MTHKGMPEVHDPHVMLGLTVQQGTPIWAVYRQEPLQEHV